MNLLLIIGSTGVGKTNYSIENAKKYNAPVIVLDRIQCFPELSITSGRPDESEYRGTKRYYLTDLEVEPGNDKLNKEFYFKKLIELLHEINKSHSNKSSQILSNRNRQQATQQVGNTGNIGCILEGGSITLLAELIPKLNKLPYKVTSIVYIRPNDSIENHQLYKSKITKRVSEMLFPKNKNQDSEILEIKRILSKDNLGEETIRNVLISLIGLVGAENVINYIEQQEYNNNGCSDNCENSDNMSLKEIQLQLIDTISSLHYNYAIGQIKIIDSLVKLLPKSIQFIKKNITI